MVRADRGAVPAGVPDEARGAAAVASQALTYSRLGLEIRPAIVNGTAGAVSFRDGKPFSVMGVTVRGGRIVELDFLADPERLRRLDLTAMTASRHTRPVAAGHRSDGPYREENTMRVFVAGASGAIGTRLVPQLIDRGTR